MIAIIVGEQDAHRISFKFEPTPVRPELVEGLLATHSEVCAASSASTGSARTVWVSAWAPTASRHPYRVAAPPAP
ncbi:hypothetical protein E2E30_04180 [Sphingomonas sp. AAP5]|nr:hypothetical protein E2E30_04180 [Sphingomonas sp. AAP5]